MRRFFLGHYHQNDIRISDEKSWNRLVNKLLFEVDVWNENVDDASSSPGLLVLGGFYGGGVQATRHEQNFMANIVNVAALSFGKHTIQFGGGVEPRYVPIFNVTNFGGTYTFPNLTDFILDRSLLYTLNVGQPQIAFNQ